MIARLIILIGLALLVIDCADFTVTGLAIIAALVIAFGWWLNQELGRARRHLAALDATVADMNEGRA